MRWQYRLAVGSAFAVFLCVGLWRHDVGLLAVAALLLVPWAISEQEARARRGHAPPGGGA